MALATRPRQRLTLATACTAQVMIVLDVLIVSVALPSLQRELRLSPAGLEWVVSAYALALAALIPAGGALGDHFGRKRAFMGGLLLFTLASIGCALSVSGAMLIGFRVIQGIGGAVMSSLTLALIAEAYPPEARTGPIGLWAAVSGLAVAGGSVVGGLLLSVFPWSSIFWVNVPIGVTTLVICKLAVAESRDPVPQAFDTAGVALSAAGLLLLTFGFVDASDATWHSPVVAGCIVAGATILVIFFWWEHRAASPMIPSALLRTAGFSRACAVYLLAYLAFSGFIYYVTLFFQNVDGWSALRTGLSWLFFCLPYFAVAQLGGRIQRRMPAAMAAGSGCFVAAAGVLGMSQVRIATAFAWPATCWESASASWFLRSPRRPWHTSRPDRPASGQACSTLVVRSAPQRGWPSWDLQAPASSWPTGTTTRVISLRRNGSEQCRPGLMSRAVRSTWQQRLLAGTRSTARSLHSSPASRLPCSWRA
jgi:DHA2 family methylenomycin A resistance protein-like MFS transporter